MFRESSCSSAAIRTDSLPQRGPVSEPCLRQQPSVTIDQRLMTVSHDDPILLRIRRRPAQISIDPYGRTAFRNPEEPRECAPIPGKIAGVCRVPEDVLDGDGSPQPATASGPFRPSARGDAIAIQATSDKSGSPAALHEKREDPLDGMHPHFFARREEASIALGDNVWFG